MHYVLHDSVDLDLKTTPDYVPQTTRMVNTKNGRQVKIGKNTRIIF